MVGSLLEHPGRASRDPRRRRTFRDRLNDSHRDQPGPGATKRQGLPSGRQHRVIGHANFPAVTRVYDDIIRLIQARGLTTVTLADVFTTKHEAKPAVSSDLGHG